MFNRMFNKWGGDNAVLPPLRPRGAKVVRNCLRKKLRKANRAGLTKGGGCKKSDPSVGRDILGS